ncbi:membrane hypothetical protein [Xenorhabdus innexi]|uniref:Wzy n=2 Tax=Xenorhabdus innexi TaxID=290109 RepID=A0A1N6MRR8_9GAMM|nr:hypothetical protein Xinn_00243 [Xenorhabdus innexi]SIP71542.1 membrane hypothetical protein [Xenorhabdus innexi]
MIISFLLFLSIFFAFLYSSKSVGISYLISSYFLSLTPIGETNIHIIIILVSILFCLYKRIFILSKKSFFILFAILITNMAPIFLSFDYNIYNTIGKLLKIFVFLLPFSLIYNKSFTINLYKLMSTFAIISILFSLLWLSVRIYDGGFLFDIRISGLVLDPNYSVIVICSVFLLTYTLKKPLSKIKLTTISLVSILILTQSISSLVIFLFIMLSVVTFKRLRRNNLLYLTLTFLVIIYIIVIFYIANNVHLTMLSDWNTNYISLKINSLLVRLYSQIEGIKIILHDPIHILYGFGSHASVELFGKVMHSAYLQTLFDHGIFLLISIYLYINIISKKHIFYLVIFYLQIMNFLFDNYFMGVVSIFFILGLISEKKPEKRVILNEITKNHEKRICPNITI